MEEVQYRDLDGCAELLGVSGRWLRKVSRGGKFATPTGTDRGPYWSEDDVWRWAARQGRTFAGRLRLHYWLDARTVAPFTSAVRLPDPYGPDDVVLIWDPPLARSGCSGRPPTR
jgi:hypothetical protein